MNDSRGIDPALAHLLARAPSVEFDYGFLMDCLKQYHSPRVKVNHLLKIRAIIRVKKGIYTFAHQFAKHPYCLEVLANMIYGPSYVSLEWACQYYSLIPERVEIVTSVTAKRKKQFTTSLKTFEYEHIHPDLYSVGVTIITFSAVQKALVATKEKALADLLFVRRGRCSSIKEMREILFEDFRIEPEDVITFDMERLQRIYSAYPHSSTQFLIRTIEQEKINNE